MSDKPATNESEVKHPVKPGEPSSEAKIGSEKTQAQNEATKRLFAAALSPGAHPAPETTTAKPAAEHSSWSLSSLTTSAENTVSGWFKSAEKPAEKSSLPAVHLVSDKPAAPAAATPLPEHASLIERAAGAVTNWRATEKSAVEAYKDFTSGNKSFLAKTTTVGAAVVAGAAFIVPEAKSLKALRGAEEFSAEHAAVALSGVNAEGKLGLKSFQALLKKGAAEDAGKLVERNPFTGVAAESTTASKLAELKLSVPGSAENVRANPFVAPKADVLPDAHASKLLPGHTEALPHVQLAESQGVVGVAKPFVADKPVALSGLNVGEADATVPRFVAENPKPKPFVAKLSEAQEIHASSPLGTPRVEAKIVAPPTAPLVEAPSIRVPGKDQILTHTETEARLAKPAHPVHDDAQANKVGDTATPIVPSKAVGPAKAVEARNPLDTHVKPFEQPTPAPAVRFQSTEAARPSSSVAPVEPIGPGKLMSPADHVGQTGAIKPVPHVSGVELSEDVKALKPTAPVDLLEAHKPAAVAKLEAPSQRVADTATTEIGHLAEISKARGAAAMNTEAARAESTIAQTQMVSRSNALTESVHKLELPTNAAPELQAAKGRLAESSLTFLQSENKAEVLKGMQSDLQVLEKSLTPDALRDVRHSIAEMQSSTSSLERSIVHGAEEQIAKVRPAEGSNLPAENSHPLNNGSTEQIARVRQAESVEAPTANVAKPTQTPTQAPSSALAQEPHAVSIQEQSLNLLAHGDLPKASREAVSKIIQDTNNWGAKSLVERSEAVSRLDANLKVLSADAGTAKDLSALSKSVDSLKTGTNMEAATVKAEKAATSASPLSEVHAPNELRPLAGETRTAGALRSEADVADRSVGAANTASHEMKFAPADSPVVGSAFRHDFEATTEKLRGHSTTLQEQSLGLLEKGGLNSRTRKALVDVVQDSGNVGRLEGAERASALTRIEQNLRIAGEDKAIAADASKMGDTFKSLEASANKAEQLRKLDTVSSEAIPRIVDETATLRTSNLTHPTSSPERVGTHLTSIEKDAAAFTSSSDKARALSGMRGDVDALEGMLGQKAVAPLRDNVDRLEMAYRDSARANKLEETAARSIRSQENLGREMKAIAESDAKLATTSRAAAEDVREVSSTNPRLAQSDINRLREGVAVVSKDVDSVVGARLNGHVHNIETNYQLQQLNRALANVTQDTTTVNRQAALAASRNSDPAVAALHHATEALKLNGVAELSAARVAYEKALPALGREDAVNINRSLSRIENQTVEAHSWNRQIAEAQQVHIARVERDAHLYPAGETQRAREIQQLVASSRENVEKNAVDQSKLASNTSHQVVFKSAFNAVSDALVSGLSSTGARWAQISDTAHKIATGVSDTILGLRTHPVATSLSLSMVAFMAESGRAMAQTSADNLHKAGQIDFSPRSQSVSSSAENSISRANAVADHGVQQPVVRGMLSAEYASLSPTIQALMRTPDGGFDPTNGQRMKFGNSFLWAAAQSGVPEEVVAKAAVYARVVKASTISVGQPDSTDKDRSRIFYPPFKSPMASISAKVRKPQNLLGTELVSLANSTSFLNSKLSPNSISLTNPLSFTREKADGGSEDRSSSGAVTPGSSFDLAQNGQSTSTALLNATVPDPNAQTVAQSAVSES